MRSAVGIHVLPAQAVASGQGRGGCQQRAQEGVIQKHSSHTGVTASVMLDGAWSQQNRHIAQMRIGTYSDGLGCLLMRGCAHASVRL